MEIDKKVKLVGDFSKVYFVIYIGVLAVGFLSLGRNIIEMWHTIACLMLFVVTFVGSEEKKIYGPIFGIIASILLFITFDFIAMAMAIGLTINCMSLIKALKGRY